MSDNLTFEKKNEFYRQLEDLQGNKKCRKMYSRVRCQELLEIIRKNRNNPHRKDPSVYYVLESFNLFHIGGKDHLIAKGEDVKDEIKYIVATEDLFEILKQCHETTDQWSDQ